MKKKLIFAVFAVLIAVTLLCSACARKKNILSYCDSISDAKSATQVITVKNGDSELAKETFSYNFVTGKVSIERKTLNSSDADELYTTTTETKDITGGPTVNITRALLTDVTEEKTVLKARVSRANLDEMFGIQSSNVQGDARIEIVAEGEHIVSITVTYTSANGNAVRIVTDYVY